MCLEIVLELDLAWDRLSALSDLFSYTIQIQANKY